MSQSNIGNNELISRVNNTLVLQAVRKLQPTFRAEVARETQLKPATVTGIVSDLLSQRLVRELPVRKARNARSGGRPPMMIELNRDARLILAVDLEPDCVRVALTNLMVEIVEYREALIDRLGNPETVIATICDYCNELLAGTNRSRVLGLGLSLPGLLDRDAGVLLSSTNMPRWHNVHIADTIARSTGLKPRVERSAHLAAMHEDWCSPEIQEPIKLILSLRTGIGMSLIRRGEVFTGSHGFDGEIGHTIVDIEGAPCECGSRGCLETFVNPSAICGRVNKMLAQGRCLLVKEATDAGEPLRPELVYRLAKEGDPDCARIVREVGRYIGIAASNLINLMGPNRLVLCGSIDTADELILEAVREQIEVCALPKMREHLTVSLAIGKEKAPLLGAAVLVAQDMFSLPNLHEVKSRVKPRAEPVRRAPSEAALA